VTTIVDGMAGVLMQSLTADGGEGANPKEAMRGALLWLADNVSDEMCKALVKYPDTNGWKTTSQPPFALRQGVSDGKGRLRHL
jgi:hypothetical protein